jgi:hypothetical protein
MDPNAINDLERVSERLGRLEGTVRVLMAALVVLGGLLAWSLVRREPASAPATVSARAFTVRDQGGTVRASFGVASGGRAGLTLADAQGRPRVVVAVPATGAPTLTLSGADGSRAILGATELRAAGAFRGETQVQTRSAGSLVLDDRARGAYWASP